MIASGGKLTVQRPIRYLLADDADALLVPGNGRTCFNRDSFVRAAPGSDAFGIAG